MILAVNISDPSGRINPNFVELGDMLVLENRVMRSGFRVESKKHVKELRRRLKNDEFLFIASLFRDLKTPLLETESLLARRVLLHVESRMALGDPLLDQYMVDTYLEAKAAWQTAQKLDWALSGKNVADGVFTSSPVEDRKVETWNQ